MKHPLQEDLTGAIGAVAASFDRATVGHEIGLAAVGAIPQLAKQRDDELVEETVLAATSNVVAIMDGLIGGANPDQIAAPSVSLKWAEWLVHRNIDAAAVPWAYNTGSNRMVDALREVTGRLEIEPEQRWKLGEGLSRYVQVYVESVCAQMVDHYVAVNERWQSGTPGVRRETVERLLAGEMGDTAEAGAALGYLLGRPHLAAIVWSPAAPDGRPPVRLMERAAERLLRSHGATDVLAVANGQTSVWAWGSGVGLSDRLEHPELTERDMLAALGSVAGGLEGFVQSHHDAQRARHMAALLKRRERSVVPFRSVALTALMANDAEEAVRFLEAELGTLTADTDSARRLRATLQVYLEEGMRPVRTARRLGVHQNTVAYRITQAEKAVGQPLAERRLELEMALRLADAREALRSSAQGG